MSAPMKALRIFLSYRRGDSSSEAGRIYDRLTQHFGRDAIFKDIDSIPLGVNFRQRIDSIIQECDVVLVVIGDKWLGSGRVSGETRLDDARDMVRIEVESALRRDIPVVPLLVKNAAMPPEESLPSTLTELAHRNGMTIGYDPNFHKDVDRLISHLEALLEIRSRTKPPLGIRQHFSRILLEMLFWAVAGSLGVFVGFNAQMIGDGIVVSIQDWLYTEGSDGTAGKIATFTIGIPSGAAVFFLFVVIYRRWRRNKW